MRVGKRAIKGINVLCYHILFSMNNVVVAVVQSLNHVQIFATPWTAACQASLSITISQSLLKLMSIESWMLSNHLILCCPLLLLPSIFSSIRVFSNELAVCIRWPTYWNFSFSIGPFSQGWFPWGLTSSISSQGHMELLANSQAPSSSPSCPQGILTCSALKLAVTLCHQVRGTSLVRLPSVLCASWINYVQLHVFLSCDKNLHE